MALHQFSLETIGHVDDGRISLAWQLAVKRVLADLNDRPGVKDVRKVVMQAEFSPVMDEDGQFETVDVSFQIKDTVPTRKSKVINMQARKGMLVFNDLAEDDAHQRTLDEEHPDSFE